MNLFIMEGKKACLRLKPRQKVYNPAMSFQAYLDNIEVKTGKTPDEFIELARGKGYDKPDVKSSVIVNWLKEDYGLGRGHAMALVHVIKNGPQISDKYVGTDGTHRDDSNMLRLDGLENRAADV